ncbi:Uncharacterised protein [Arthrobacter agilis]|nr:Uncharacterised protein [Arthrobacter agilis]
MGIETVRPAQWIRDNRSALPSIIALALVAAFWVVGAIGGIGFLAEASSPMTMLVGLYAGLSAVAVSIIVAILALNDLAGRYTRPRTRR